MSVVTGVVQGVLAQLFGMASITKATQQDAMLNEQLPWTEHFYISRHANWVTSMGPRS
jgi:hypothetical protein